MRGDRRGNARVPSSSSGGDTRTRDETPIPAFTMDEDDDDEVDEASGKDCRMDDSIVSANG